MSRSPEIVVPVELRERADGGCADPVMRWRRHSAPQCYSARQQPGSCWITGVGPMLAPGGLRHLSRSRAERDQGSEHPAVNRHVTAEADGASRAAWEDHDSVVKLTRELVRIPSRAGADAYGPVQA